jgi:phage shock protein E
VLLLSAAIAGCAEGEVQALSADALVVDVRTPLEYGMGHYDGAVNIPVGEIEERLGELGDKRDEIVVYCRSGHRSADAKTKLRAAGFTNVYDGGSLRYMESLPPPEPD